VGRLAVDEQVRAAAALADPTRFQLLTRLLSGPATVAELVASTGATQPAVSNHLRLMRERRLVSARREGRTTVYRLRGPEVAHIVEALWALGPSTPRPRAPAPIAVARTCYDHLAGRLGVAILDGLRKRRALDPADESGSFDLGPKGSQVLARLGVDLDRVASGRRRFAYACLDWTEGQAHLGGALGAAICRRAIEAGWIAPRRGTRAVLVTGGGRRAMRRLLGVELSDRRKGPQTLPP
jgi:DNA-binding transcriptional ArsR family regulator